MTRRSPGEQLDKIVERILGRSAAPLAWRRTARPSGAKLAMAIQVIGALRDLPRPNFKAGLKSDLQRRATMATPSGKLVNPVREGFHSITPYLVISRAPQLMDFFKQA